MGVRVNGKLSLIAEIDNHRKTSAPKAGTSDAGIEKRSSKKSIWKSNKKELKRMHKEPITLNEESHVMLKQKAIMQAKAKLYEKMRKGDTQGITDAHRATMNVDFDAKRQQDWERREADMDSGSEADSDSMDEENLQPLPHEPMVEVTDEFGRTRTVPQSQAAKIQVNVKPEESLAEEAEEDEHLIYGDQNIFPVFEMSAEERQARYRKQAEAELPLEVHYDATTENRARGAAAYNFSKDADERNAQMESIKSGLAGTQREIQMAKQEEKKESSEIADRKALLAEKKRKLLAARSAAG